MRDVALSWQLWELTHSPLAMGLLGAARVVPVILLALGGGVAADALDRRRLMFITQTLMAVSSAILALGSFGGHVTPAWIYALIALGAAATAFDNPARQALVPSLLPDADLPNGLSISVFGGQVSTVAGPALGGLLLGATSAGVVYAVDAASFLAVIVALLFVRPRPRASSAPPVRVSFTAIAEAFAFLRRTPVLLWLMLVDFLATFFAGSMQLLPVFADRVFGLGPRALGLLLSAPAVGSVLTSAWMSARPSVRRQGAVVLGAVAVYGAAIMAFGFSRSFPLSLGLLAISGAADTASTVVRQVARQTLTPDELRGRMASVNMIFFMGGPQLGEVEAGVVAHVWNAPISVASGGAACVLVAAAFALLVPALRRLRTDEAGFATSR
jgi:MFS family permease